MKLKSIEDKDINIMRKWLEKPYILKWYKDIDEWINEISLRDSSYSFVHQKIVYVDDKPIGFCQYYDCYFAKEDWYTVNEEKKVYSIDYLIGEEEYLNKGLGVLLVKELVKEINIKHHNPLIIVQPEKENIVSQKTLIKAGFIYDEAKEYYTYKAFPYGFCGMPCGLCTRYHISGTSRCVGCSDGGYYTDSCKANHCCKEKGIMHCGRCSSFPCKFLGKMSDFKDLNTHDVKQRTCKLISIDFDKWYSEYNKKCQLLLVSLENNNDGRMKRYLCELFINNDYEILKRVVEEGKFLKGKEFKAFVDNIINK